MKCLQAKQNQTQHWKSQSIVIWNLSIVSHAWPAFVLSYRSPKTTFQPPVIESKLGCLEENKLQLLPSRTLATLASLWKICVCVSSVRGGTEQMRIKPLTALCVCVLCFSPLSFIIAIACSLLVFVV